MTQEDKELLLKDLCVRLPYEVICTDNIHGDGRISNIDINLSSGEVFVYFWDFDEYVKIENIKPYLRPMSSMTEEERRELTKLVEEDLSEFAKFITEGHGLSHDGLYMFDKKRQLDWLLKNHFDFRGLLPKGLALEAPKGIYEY